VFYEDEENKMDTSTTVQQTPAKQGDSSSKPQTFTAKAYAAHSATTALAPFTLRRRSPRPQDVQIEILYCGICHSDLHQVRNEWQSVMPTVYPCVPGHEIVGRVVNVGSAVKKFKEGDIAASAPTVAQETSSTARMALR
jgi:D-arabinose 1-dehydrogenase-like Zn-dependent alcohol dehydrogenase